MMVHTMKRKPTKDTTMTEQTTSAPEATPQQRTEQCLADLRAVLQRHGCRIVAFFGHPQQVGEGSPPSRVLLSAEWGVVLER